MVHALILADLEMNFIIVLFQMENVRNAPQINTVQEQLLIVKTTNANHVQVPQHALMQIDSQINHIIVHPVEHVILVFQTHTVQHLRLIVSIISALHAPMQMVLVM